MNSGQHSEMLVYLKKLTATKPKLNPKANILYINILLSADLDALDMFAVTPVHLAAEGGHLDCLRLLLEAGASFNCGTAYKRPQWISNTGNFIA